MVDEKKTKEDIKTDENQDEKAKPKKRFLKKKTKKIFQMP